MEILTVIGDDKNISVDLDQLISVVKPLQLNLEPASYIVHLDNGQLVMKVVDGDNWVYELLVSGHRFSLEKTSKIIVKLGWIHCPKKSSGTDGYIPVYYRHSQQISIPSEM